MALRAARCMESLGSRGGPRYSNWHTSRMKSEWGVGEDRGRVCGRGAGRDWVGVGLLECVGQRGFQKMPSFWSSLC